LDVNTELRNDVDTDFYMLQELTIKNYALIEHIQVSTEKGLNILTGETGAGKSIIIGALSFLLGERATADSIRKNADCCEVSALFALQDGYLAKPFLIENDIVTEKETEVLLKRVLNIQGKNRCYINGLIVTNAIMQKVGRYLVDIHGQQSHQLLFNIDEQTELIDRFGGHKLQRQNVLSLYRIFREKSDELEILNASEKDRNEQLDLYRFQLKEITETELKPQEEDELDREYNILNNAEKISLSVQCIYDGLYGKEESVKASIDKLSAEMDKLSQIDDSFNKHNNTLSEIKYQVEEIVNVMENYKEKLEFNPDRLEAIIERKELIKKLKRKYNKSVTELIGLKDELQAKLKKLDDSPEAIKKLEEQLALSEEKLKKEAAALSKKRKTASIILSDKVEKELKDLAMGKTRFFINIEPGEIKQTGMDNIEFLISPNKGEGLKPLAKIASGGETARIMLAIKTVLSEADRVPVLIFDEIDAGIGGEAAWVVGKKLSGLASKHQVICVTHLPQIAGFADVHFHVDKAVKSNRTVTSIEKLNKDGRIDEIARMLGGEKITTITQKHAREIVERNSCKL